MEAVRAGAGREQAHEAIKEHAVQVVRDLRSGRIHENDLAQRLADDERLHLSKDQVCAIWPVLRSPSVARANRWKPSANKWPEKCSNDLKRATLTPAQFFKIAFAH